MKSVSFVKNYIFVNLTPPPPQKKYYFILKVPGSILKKNQGREDPDQTGSKTESLSQLQRFFSFSCFTNCFTIKKNASSYSNLETTRSDLHRTWIRIKTSFGFGTIQKGPDPYPIRVHNTARTVKSEPFCLENHPLA